MTRKFTIVGNWKMFGSKQQVSEFFAHLGSESSKLENYNCEMVVCPPAIYLPQAQMLRDHLPHIRLGAQDVSAHEKGAYTGQISAKMLSEQGCGYVIVGHSERRHYCHETDEEIADKFFATKAAGMIPILCVGETKEQRQMGQTDEIVVVQLSSILARGANAFAGTMIAYEPVWAIGTGLTATPEEANHVHHLLRQTVAKYDALLAAKLPILYGGSVKAANAQTLFEMADIDGALVGGASVQAPDFLAICEKVL